MGDDASDLFARRTTPSSRAPLADRMRPRSLDEVAGQDTLVGAGAPLRALADAGELPSLILWGPPGCGKTTLARLLARGDDVRFHPLSAVSAGVADVRTAVKQANLDRATGRRFVLFLDEIHRFNRAQQDALLPHVEAGTLTLIGATTENPSFEVIAPLLSRARVFTLEPLAPEALAALLERAATDAERGLGQSGVALGSEARDAISHAADGDARRALGLLEAAVALAQRSGETELRPERVQETAGRRILLHDKEREEHFNVISALIKSLRASDPDAALYYLARLLAAGEDATYVARRLVIFASEDVGNAEPQGLQLASSALVAAERIGMPEARIPLAQVVTFLACAPKSNASYTALGRAWEAAEKLGPAPVPLHLRNAPTPLMKELGYGRDYRYAHSEPDAFVPDRNLPDALGDRVFYEPSERGAEADLAERLRTWRQRRIKKGDGP
ncbi:MAG: replication-associated recombination protein A [Deltaproteobacteria bacterium]|nr:replication-associated recombination protein A [Deltaproteobacteria bacterium]